MKKILYCSYSEIPSRTANSMAVMKQCAALTQKARLKVILIKGTVREDYTEFYQVPSLDMILLPRWALWWNELFLKLFVLIFALFYRPDFVYSRDLLLIRPLCRVGISCMYEMHQLTQMDEEFDQHYKMLLKKVMDECELIKIVCISHELMELCVLFGVDREKLTVLHSGAQLPSAPPIPMRFQTRPTVMYSGSTQPGKGVDIVFSTARLASDYDFVVLDDMPIAATALPQNVRHIPWVEPAKVAGFLRKADILLIPFTEQRYTFYSPLKLFEYLAAGKVIIASDISGVREVLRDGENAILVPPGDPAALFRAIERVSSDPELQLRLQICAANTARQYTWDKRAEAIVAC